MGTNKLAHTYLPQVLGGKYLVHSNTPIVNGCAIVVGYTTKSIVRKDIYYSCTILASISRNMG